jgi:cytoskeletal protein RodZ
VSARWWRIREDAVKLEHFGSFLKQGREAKGLSIADLSRATKIKDTLLEQLEGARLDVLPAQVFVRGFVTAYARAVGIDAGEALLRYRAHMARIEHREPEVSVPHKAIRPARVEDDRPPELDRRRMSVVMVVLLVLVVATLTLSLLLRHGPGTGAGLS